MTRAVRGRLPLLATTAGALVLLALAFRDVEPARVLSVIGSAQIRLLLVALVIDAVIFVIKAAKWQYVFAPVKRVPLPPFFSAIAVASLSIAVLPLRLDELVRSFFLSRKTGVPPATVLGTIVVERLADATVLLAAVAVLLLSLPGHGLLARGGLVLLAATVSGAFAITLLARRPGFAERAAGLVPGRWAPLRAWTARTAHGLAEGLRALPHAGRMAVVFAFVIAEWLMTIAYMRAVLAAFGIDLPAAAHLALVTAAYSSFAVPAAPGSLGVFELLTKETLAFGFAQDAHVAMACALTLHFMLVAPISAVGAWVMLKEGLSLARLREMGAAPGKEALSAAGGAR
jgi:uncharacterized protein (TIRG00374 family)